MRNEPQLRLHVLGPLRVERVTAEGNEPLEIAGWAVPALLAVLAAHPGEVPRDYIVELFLGEGAVGTKSASQNTYDWTNDLRRAVGDDERTLIASHTGRKTLELRRGKGWWIDYDEFRNSRVAGRHADALALVRGDFAENIPQAFLEGFRTALRREATDSARALKLAPPDRLSDVPSLLPTRRSPAPGQVGRGAPFSEPPARRDSDITRVAPGLLTRSAGVDQLRISEIVAPDGCYIPIPWRTYDASPQPEPAADLVRHIEADWLTYDSPTDPISSHFLVVAPPGLGKSTLTYRLATAVVGASDRPVCHIQLGSLRSQRSIDAFATEEWLETYLTARGLAENAASVTTILDGIDELCAGMEETEIAELLSRFLFTRALLATCRLTYFERYVSRTTLARQAAAIFELQPLPAQTQDLYVAGYVRLMAGAGSHTAADVTSWLDTEPYRREFCSTPFNLSIAVRASLERGVSLRDVNDLCGLLRLHVDNTLSGEAQRGTSVLSRTEKSRLLEQLAWRFYDEEGAGAAEPAPFTRQEVEGLLAEEHLREGRSAVVLEDLEFRTLLRTIRDPRTVEGEMLQFSHRSIHDYFVALSLFHGMIGQGGDPETLFSKFLSGTVSRLLIELITRLTATPRLRAFAVNRLFDALGRLDKEDKADAASDALTLARRRIARQQIVYYLGALRTRTARSGLAELFPEEEDLWVRRGMAVALALAGEDRYLMAEVDARREERTTGAQPPSRCEVNLGYHLSFCGDQPLELTAPDEDQGLPSCALTVKTLVRQLRTPAKRGSWRSTLFTFVDLARHRPVSSASFEQATRSEAPALRHALDHAARESDVAQWPELREALQILDELAV